MVLRSFVLLLFALPVFSSAQTDTQPVYRHPVGPQAAPQAPPQPGQLADTMSAPPFTVGDKFDYRIVQMFGFKGLAGSLVGAAIGQAAGSPYEWGGGMAGFGKRYVSGFGGNLSRQTFAFALESALHEDPRYFPSEEKGFKARSWNAIKQIVYCKKDDGTGSLAYARVISAFGNGQFVNTWQPDSTGSVGDGFKRGLYTLGGDAAYNFLQEFVPFARPRSLRDRH